MNFAARFMFAISILLLACSSSRTSPQTDPAMLGGSSAGNATSQGGSGSGFVDNGGQTASASGGLGVAGSSNSGGRENIASGGTTKNVGGSNSAAGGSISGLGGATVSSGGLAMGGTSARSGGSKSTGGTIAGSGGTTVASGGLAGGGTTARTGGSPGTGGTVMASGGTAGAMSIPGWGTPVTGGPSGTGVAATVTVDSGHTVGNIGADFTGFSYEKTHIMNGSLTSSNTSLVSLYRLLGSPSLRIGANDVETCTWIGTGPAPSQPNGRPFNTKVTTGGVDQLCSFLTAAGSKAIYGVNFRLNDVKASTAEVAYVMGKCPSSIEAFEIGNEPDKFGTWSSQQAEYETFATSILGVNGAVIAGPAVTSGAAASFTTPFAASEAAKLGLLTQHSYVAGATSSDATVTNLQTITSKLLDIFSTLNTAASSNKIKGRYRMGECNTFSGHGKQGLSDTLISALWAIDYMFTVAKNGGAGVNFHGGEIGMDGTTPYYYSPIIETNGVVTAVQPEYYGMLLFAEAGSGAMASTTVSTSNTTFTAYAIKANGFTSVVLDNKSASSGVNATVNLGTTVSSASAIYLQGTPTGSLTVPAGSVTLAGAVVTTAGVWQRKSPYVQSTSGSTVSVFVPPASAALVRVLP